MSASARNGTKSVRSSSARGASTTGSSRWLSARARPWPGMCLITGSTPPVEKPSAAARRDRRDAARVGAVGAVADRRRATPATGTSATGAQSTSMPSARSSARDQPRVEPRRLARGIDIALGAARAICAAGGAARQCGGLSRATRPPSWSIRTGASAPADRVAERFRPERAPDPVSSHCARRG